MIGFGIPHGMELLIVLAVVLLLFGHRLPGMARSLGSGITEFKRGLKDGSTKKDGDDSSSADSSSADSSKADSDSSGSR
ncbi:MAG: sec-independent protein translocase protein TatA [Planctomycetota bacterium]|jgi:sec-independent protein translocase protein TatA